MDREILDEQLNGEQEATAAPIESLKDTQIAPQSQVKAEPKAREGKAGPERKKSNDEQKSPTQKALELAGDLHLFPFHTPEMEAFVSIPVDGHRETFPLEDRKFREWFSRKYYENERSVLSEQNFNEFRNVMIGRGLYDGPQIPVYVRVAEHDGAIYLDLANEAWEAVKITPESWEVVHKFPVVFRRVKGMKSLPHPTRGSHVDALRHYVNVGSEDDWRLSLGWLVAAFRPIGPYPILALEGSQGTAKSTTTRVFRSLIDPNTAPLRSAPRDERDLMISAVNTGCTSLENVSHIPHWLSDALCRLSTGSGLATRRLYTDADEYIFEAARPIILNGIHIGIRESDLLDRMILITLPQITAESRIPEAEFWRRFEKDRPAILGALLGAVACALKRISTVELSRLPRMADFAKWVTAAEPALGWQSDEFLDVYHRNQIVTSERALDSSPLTGPIEDLLSSGKPWQGTATELLSMLSEYVGTGRVRPKYWPTSPAQLSGMLHRLSPNLNAIGIQIEFTKSNGTNSRKIIHIKRDPKRESQ